MNLHRLLDRIARPPARGAHDARAAAERRERERAERVRLYGELEGLRRRLGRHTDFLSERLLPPERDGGD